MAMGRRQHRERQEDLWVAHTELATAPGHPFYERLNEVLEAESFDAFVESRCARFYATGIGRPGLTPGIYFRSLLIGYFEGIGAERGIAWRLADSLALRRFVGIALDEYTPDHSTISRTRRLIDIDTHREVFAWVLGVLADLENDIAFEVRKTVGAHLERIVAGDQIWDLEQTLVVGRGLAGSGGCFGGDSDPCSGNRRLRRVLKFSTQRRKIALCVHPCACREEKHQQLGHHEPSVQDRVFWFDRIDGGFIASRRRFDSQLERRPFGATPSVKISSFPSF